MSRCLAVSLALALVLAACSSRTPSPDLNSASAGASASEATRLDPQRRVAEQDCSKPVDLYQGNLRCK